jgi:hypothetical protein
MPNSGNQEPLYPSMRTPQDLAELVFAEQLRLHIILPEIDETFNKASEPDSPHDNSDKIEDREAWGDAS